MCDPHGTLIGDEAEALQPEEGHSSPFNWTPMLKMSCPRYDESPPAFPSHLLVDSSFIQSISEHSILKNATKHLTTLQDEACRAVLDHCCSSGELIHTLTF